MEPDAIPASCTKAAWASLSPHTLVPRNQAGELMDMRKWLTALLAAAMLLTGIGAAVTVNMRLVPNPGDGIVAAVAERLGRDQGFAKNCFDLVCVALTVILSLVMLGKVVAVGLGTVLAMVVCTVLGITIERLAYKPLRQATSLAVLITAIKWHIALWQMRSAPALWTTWWGRGIFWAKTACSAASSRGATCPT